MATCAMTGVIPDEPVVSLKTGHVFEKRVVEKHLETTGMCPVSNQVLSVHDLIPLKCGDVSKPRPPVATSIPNMLNIMQSEWDTLMLETYSLRSTLETVRQELAHSLYQYDAACRVIARLVKERDEARAALADTQGNITKALGKTTVPAATSSADQEMSASVASEDIGISAQVIQVLNNTSKALSKNRKKVNKENQAKAAPAQAIQEWKPIVSHTLHSTTNPGITCLDLNRQDADLVVTGGNDSNAILFNTKNGKQEDQLKGHKKRITDVKFHGSEKIIFTASADTTAKMWKEQNGKFEVATTFKTHNAEVTAVTVHPSGQYLVTGSKDKTWAFHDIATGVCRDHHSDDKYQAGYTKIMFHPDGVFMAAGTQDKLVRIFDMAQRKCVATLPHDGAITGISFSENGYHVASGDENGVVKVWDLRKLENIQTLEHSGDNTAIGCINFDMSGLYLGVGYGDNIRVYGTKTWNVVNAWESAHKDSVTGLQFGTDSKFLISTGAGKDRTLKIFV